MESFNIQFEFGGVDHNATVTKENAGHEHYKVSLVKSGDVYVSKKDGEWIVCCGPSIDIDYGIARIIGREIEQHSPEGS